MSIKEISAVSNPVVKSIRALAMKKVREREGTFLAEGMKLATDALDAGWTVRILVVPTGADDRTDAVAARAHAAGADILRCTNKVMQAIARRDNPQTVMAVIDERLTPPDAVQPAPGQTWIGLDRVRDPGNLGTVIRTADALGASGVILIDDTTDPFSTDAVRATMGSLFHVPIVRARIEQMNDLKARFVRTVGTHLEGAVDHRTVAWDRTPLLLLMGNEQHGLAPALVDLCDELALIAMAGQADSMNLAVSTGIALFEARRHALSVVTA